MPTNHNPVFRCPVDAMDEIIPSLTLAQWAQGGSESEHCDSCGNTQFRTYEPGEIVRFQASQTLTVITYTYGQNGMEGPEPPAGVTRFVAENDFENQQETLEAFHRERGEYGIELGDTSWFLNQKIFPCFRMNHRRRQVLMNSPAEPARAPRGRGLPGQGRSRTGPPPSVLECILDMRHSRPSS